MWVEGGSRRGEENLLQYLEEVFAGCLGADAGIEIRITTAYRIGILRKVQKTPRDVLLKLPDWPTKLATLCIFKEQQGLEIEGE